MPASRTGVPQERHGRLADISELTRPAAVNLVILRRQTLEGITPRVGQALLEHSHYDPESGQLLAASLVDYALPRADTSPKVKTALSGVPSPSNRLGARSGGEAGTTSALAAVIKRDCRRAGGVRRAPHRNAGDPRARLARDPSNAHRQRRSLNYCLRY